VFYIFTGIYIMESSPNLETKMQIPSNQIYKAFILDDEGKVNRVHIFCANTKDKSSIHSLFSDLELAYFEKENVEFVFSELFMHSDDTIRVAKYKIIQELESYYAKQKEHFTCSPEELYLYSSKHMIIDFDEVFLQITQNKRETMTKEEFYYYSSLLSLDVGAQRTFEGKMSFSPDKTNYSWSDWNQCAQTYGGKIFVPIGMDFQSKFDFLFPSNPYFTQISTSPIRYQFREKNALYSMENSLLLNYLDEGQTDIMVCLGKNVLDFSLKHGISEKYMTLLYYPQLNVDNQEALIAEKEVLYEKYKEEYSSWLKYRNEIVYLYYEIHLSKKSDLQYSEKGVREISFTLYSDYAQKIFPLDFLFKQIHSSEKIPFIKYNPGIRRENMYRLYSNEISNNGKKIPFLEDALIFRLNKELRKGNHISIYIQENDPIHVYVDHHGKFLIHCTLKDPMEMDVLEKYLFTHLDPLFQNIKTLLQPLGYSTTSFTNFQDNNMKNVNIQYGFSMILDKKLDLQKKPFLYPIFDVHEDKIHKNAQITLKRVENYKEMDAKNAKIVELVGKGNSNEDILQMLVDEYNMTHEEAILDYGEFRSQYQLFKERIVENPGFPITLKMKPLKNELVVTIHDITSPKYIPNIFIYLDTIVRVSLYPKTIGLEKSKVDFFKKPFKGKQEEAEVENIIHAVGTQLPVGNYLAQPVRFGEEEESKEESAKGMGIMFEEDYDYDFDEGEAEEGEQGENESLSYGGENSAEDLEEKKKELEGKSIKNPTPFFRRMMDLDPTLFVTEETSKYPLYSKACPSGDRRQPVVLTDEEKEKIDQTNPGSYGHALYYGSDPNKKHWYVCPRYWCLLTNMSISEEDVKAGKCGNVIPKGADRIPKGAYVYEFNYPKVHMKDGKYLQHVPGFLKKEKHPDGLCAPCCFGKSWDSKDQTTRRKKCLDEDDGEKDGKQVTMKTQAYVIGPVTYPLPEKRWGFLPISVQHFFDEDSSRFVDPQNPSFIMSNTSCLLRYGLEQNDKRSFMGVIAYYYAYKQGLEEIPTIDEMSKKLATLIDLDLFLQVQNGNLPSIFKPKTVDLGTIDINKYKDTRFFGSIDLQIEDQLNYLEDTIASYENFLDYIQDVDAELDYSFLWDIVCMENPSIMRDGFNLAILKVSESDIYEKVQYVCPSNVFSNVKFDSRKETIILLQQDIYFEPVHFYESKDAIVSSKTNDIMYELKKGETIIKNVVVNKNRDVVYKLKSTDVRNQNVFMKKAFLEQTAMEPIKDMLQLIHKTSQKYCVPMPSMPKKYTFKKAIPAQDLLRLLKTYHYNVNVQITNYRNKTIAFLVNREEDQSTIYVPCYPSAKLENMESKFMDDPDLWLDYRMTRDRLENIYNTSEGKIPCNVKVKIVEDEMVVGFLTNTNQFVQINPPSQVIDEDGIPIVKHSSYILPDGKQANKVLTTDTEQDKKRMETILKIKLETDFYNVFRSLARMLLHEQNHYKSKRAVLDIIDNNDLLYKKQLQALEKELRNLMLPYVSFQEIKTEDLESIRSIMVCKGKDTCESTTGNEWKTCLITQQGNCANVFPKYHLLGQRDNDRVYFARLADELLRYERIRVFMLEPKKFLNIGSSEFKINEDELFLLESVLNKDYFVDLVPYSKNKYVTNISYDNAQPSMSQKYSNKVGLKEQAELIRQDEKEEKDADPVISDYLLDCIKETRAKVIGNEKPGSWKPLFPSEVKELIFEKTKVCTFMPLIYIFQDIHKGASISIQNVKTSLWKGYTKLMKHNDNASKIVHILNKQGKTELMTKVKSKTLTLEEAIFNDDYYLTDMDYWVFCNYNKIPVILFSSTTLKYLSNVINWLHIGGQSRTNERYYFIRSPVDRRLNEGSSYHLLMPSVSLENMKNNMFVEARDGKSEYQNNWQSIDNYLLKYHIISKRKK
jgi:hypothetical protein